MAQLKVLAVLAMVWLASPAAFAHHPFADEFDRTQTVTLSGTVTRIDWQNPHVYAYVDVKDPAGKNASWKIEMGSPEALTREGWTRTSVKAGDQITITVRPAKAGTPVGLINRAQGVVVNGKQVLSGDRTANAID